MELKPCHRRPLRPDEIGPRVMELSKYLRKNFNAAVAEQGLFSGQHLKLRPFHRLFRRSRAVLAPWQGGHRLSRLAGSSVPPWVLALMWSTVVAWV